MYIHISYHGKNVTEGSKNLARDTDLKINLNCPNNYVRISNMMSTAQYFDVA